MDAPHRRFSIDRSTEEPLPEIDTVFWDIGGVVLTNGWDRASRKEAAQAFQLDWAEFSDRHDLSFPAFDCGQITLEEYLNRTLFYRPRTFTREEFIAFMFAQSRHRFLRVLLPPRHGIACRQDA
jgi:putative hydrolase of the HAD superfamily